MIISDSELKAICEDLAALLTAPTAYFENKFLAFWRDAQEAHRYPRRDRELSREGREVAELAARLTGEDYARCLGMVEDVALDRAWQWEVRDELRRLAELARGGRERKAAS